MKKLQDFLTEDTNQFGPGTDLIISLMGVLLVMITISTYLYSKERVKNQDHKDTGKFKLASAYFSAGDFKPYPVTELTNPAKTRNLMSKIINDYKMNEKEYPYVFIIGHSNRLDDPKAKDKSYRARLERNWEYAGRRAAAIAGLMQEYLTEKQKERIIVVTTGELDMKIPGNPYSQENSWVEIVFGKEWKIPARSIIQ